MSSPLPNSLKVDSELTRKIANLARLELTDAEVSTFTSQLGDILAYVDQLSEVNVEGIAPLTHPLEMETLRAAHGFTPLREDEGHDWPKSNDGKPKVFGSAPEIIEDGFKVPPVL